MSSNRLIRRRRAWFPTLRSSLPDASTESGSASTIASEHEVCEIRSINLADVTELSEKEKSTGEKSKTEDEHEDGTAEVSRLGDDIQPMFQEIDSGIRGIEPMDVEQEAEQEIEENQLMVEEIAATTDEIGPLVEESEPVVEQPEQVIEEIEPGTEEIGDHHRKKGTAQIFNTLRMLRELDESGPDVDLGIKHHEYLKMQSSVIFHGTNANFFCDFQIQNTSGHIITYVVKTPNPHKFEIPRSRGLLDSFSDATIKIRTNPDTVKEFSDIANEVFKVIGLPICTPRSYLSRVFLEDYWTAYGIPAFPSIMAEAHDIKVLPENEEHSSMLGWVSMLRKYAVILVQYFNPDDEDVQYVLDANRGIEFAQNKHIVCRYLKHLKKRDNPTYKGRISFRDVICVALLAIGIPLLYFIVASRINFELPFANLEMICGQMNCTYYGIRYPPPQQTWFDFFCAIWSKITFGWWNCQN